MKKLRLSLQIILNLTIQKPHKPQKPGKLPNFDDKKYGGAKDHKENQEVGKKEQKSSPLSRFLARVFTPEKIEIRSNPIYYNMETYKVSQSQDESAIHDNKIEDKAKVIRTDGSNSKEISSKVKKSEVEQVDSNKSRTPK